MSSSSLPEPIWLPADDVRETTHLGRFIERVERATDRTFPDHQTLWRWSVDHIEEFWEHVWDFVDVGASRGYDRILADGETVSRRWIEGARLNYAQRALVRTGDAPALVGVSDTRETTSLNWDELRNLVARIRVGLRRLGVGPGDTVVAYLPNVPETMAAFLATASLGAVWATAAPEFGAAAVLDRFRPCEPKVLLTIGGYRFGDRDIDKTDAMRELDAGLGVDHTVFLPYGDWRDTPDAMVAWDDLIREEGELEFEQVDVDHPLYILFSSGTTGPPKPIVHGHGGTLLEHLKVAYLHADFRPDDRFLWFTTTGWMMWNFLAVGLLAGSTVVTFDGDPNANDGTRLWELAEEQNLTWLGLGAPYLTAGWRKGQRPGSDHDLSRLRELGVTGSPLSEKAAEWVYESVHPNVHLSSMSGGTDVCTAFVGGSPISPVWPGELSCRYLGVAAYAFDEDGTAVVDEPGELVITEPMPSMPVGFLGDDDGSRFNETYFTRYPGLWAHGDWVRFTEEGTSRIFGRSDATLNRGGVRIGTSEYAGVLDRSPLIEDHLIVHRNDPTAVTAGELWLFIVESSEAPPTIDPAVEISALIRTELSPRHVPDVIRVVGAIPRTKTGKKLEVPIKRLLEGSPVEKAINFDALAVRTSIDEYLEIVAELD